MIDNIIRFSITNKFVIAILMAGLVAWGSYSLTQIPLDALPDITNNQVQVITLSSSLAAQEVEQYITTPLELGFSNIPKVEEIRSISRFGLSVITIVFQENADMFTCRQLVSEQLRKAEADIPPAMGKPELGPITTGLGEIFQYVIKPKPGYEKTYSLTELRSIQDWIVKRQLTGIPGVIEINSFGGRVKQYEIALNPERLRAANISLTEVFNALRDNNGNTGGSYIEKAESVYFIRGEGRITNLADMENIVVRKNGSTPLLVKNIAQVRFGNAVVFGAMTRNGGGEVVGGIVMMLKGANSADVIARVKERVARINKSLPEGLEIEPFLDRTKLVKNAISTVTNNLLEGGLIVIFVLVIMLGNFRAGLVVASVIPLALLFAIAMMNIFGVSANLMSLGAIDFGLVVDGAVIIVESIVHHLHTGFAGKARLTQTEMDDEVYHSSVRIRQSAAFGEIIILIVYLPIMALVGVEGKMFRPMAETVGFSILGALILSLTYVPMASALFLSKEISTKISLADKLIMACQRLYLPFLRFCLRHRWQVLVISIGGITGAVLIFMQMGGEFIPTLEEGDFAIEMRIAPGSGLHQTVKSSTIAERTLLKFAEVKEVVSKLGTSEVPTDPMPLENGDVIVVLKPRRDWKSGYSLNQLADTMQKALTEALPGTSFEFQQPIQMRFNELMTGIKSDVAVKIYGADLNLLSEYANQTAAAIKTVVGISGVKVEPIEGLPQIVVKYNRESLAQYGLSIADLNTIIKTAFAGEVAGVAFEAERRFDVVIRLDSAHRTNINDIKDMYADLPNGVKVPFSELADIKFRSAPMQVSHDNTYRRVVIGISVRNRDIESVVNDIKQITDKQINLPPGYYYAFGGQFENLEKAKARLMVAVPVSLLLIFFLLYFTFGSVKQAVIIFTAIPLSAIGGVLALTIRDMPFSISAGIGFIALFGVAVLNGIVMIGYFNYLEKEENIKNVFRRVYVGALVRLRPVLITAAVASLGFLPMALSKGAGAEVQKPLATVVIGGLISATLLTLIVLPVIYSLSGKRVPKQTIPMVLMLISVFGFNGISANAQVDTTKNTYSPTSFPIRRTLGLQEAIIEGLQNNGLLKIYQLDAERYRALKGTATDLGKTRVDYQYGQTQARNNDYTLSLSQATALPGLYYAQKKAAGLMEQTAQKRYLVQRNQLLRDIKSVYYQILVLYLKQNLYLQQDSLLASASGAAEIRFRTGETNKLEALLVESRKQENRNRIQMLNADIGMKQTELARLIQSNKLVSPDQKLSAQKVPSSSFTDSVSIASNPVLALLNTQMALAEQELMVEKKKRLPDMFVGYTNQSVEKVNNLQYFSVGTAIPLWSKPYNARIEAANIGRQIIKQQQIYEQQRLHSEAAILVKQFGKYLQSIKYYNEFALPQAVSILNNAQKSYKAGEIDYVEFVISSAQAWQVRETWADNLAAYNETLIAIEQLAGIE